MRGVFNWDSRSVPRRPQTAVAQSFREIGVHVASGSLSLTVPALLDCSNESSNTYSTKERNVSKSSGPQEGNVTYWASQNSGIVNHHVDTRDRRVAQDAVGRSSLTLDKESRSMGMNLVMTEGWIVCTESMVDCIL